MLIRKYDYLPDGAIQIRKEVFVKEQGFEMEFDEIDDNATHLVCYENSVPIATCRYYWNEQIGSYVIGRIAVGKNYRGKKIGACILKEAEKYIREIGGKKVSLSAQQRAMEFYKKQGFISTGEIYLDEDCPHVWMYKLLEEMNE